MVHNASQGNLDERQRESGIKAFTEGLLINDTHYVMCRLV